MAKLLIVDDEKNIRGHLATFFRERGYEVMTAEGGPQAPRAVFRHSCGPGAY